MNRMKKWLFVGGLLLSCPLWAQEGPSQPNGMGDGIVDSDSDVYIVVDQEPEFPGGLKAMYEYLMQNMDYPLPCIIDSVEGRVVCSFVVDKSGEVCDVEVAEPVHPLLDAEAVRVVKAMPRWIPGRIGNRPVRVRFSLPIRFKL